MTATGGTQSRPPLIAADIIHLAQNPSAALPPSIPHSSLLSPLSSPSPSVPVTAYLSSLLSLLSRAPPSPSLLSSLLLSFLRLLHSRHLPRDPNTTRLFHLFYPHLPNLDPSHLPSLVDLASDLSSISDYDDAQPLDLLPRLLDLAPDASLPVLDRLLAADWPKPVLPKIASLLRELPDRAKPRIPEFVEKVFDEMRKVDLQDLPLLAHQLLLLASKGPHRRAVVAGILGFFAGTLKGTASVVRQVEGTVLMHVNFAVKQDPSLGQEVMAIVRGDLSVVSHFGVAVLLSVARVRRFSESSIGVLKAAVVTSHRDYKIARDCKWLPDNLKEGFLETAKCVEKAVLRAVNESNSGREHVVPSIVQFGFVLLESVDGVKGDEGGVSGPSVGLMGVEELAIQMLKTLFEVHDMARNEIIEQCKFRILSLKPQHSTSIIKLLGVLVQSYPYPMLDYVSRLKELLDYFTFMHDKTSISLIRAILPLVKFSRELQDYIILVVRKAMFSREDTVGIAATNAIIDLFIVDKKSKKPDLNSLRESSSQASCSQQADIPSMIGGGLFHELSGLLRRCLCQQATVKEIMYNGLMKVVVLDPATAGSVFDFLWPHFLSFYIEDAEFPIRIDSCYKSENGKFSLVEPLDFLLSCVSWILLLQPHGEFDHLSESLWPCFGFSLSQENESGRTSSGESFSNALSKIRKSLIKCKLADGLGQSQDPGSRPLTEEKNFGRNLVLLGIIEVFVNIVSFDKGKATAEENKALEKDIMGLIDLHDYFESDLNKQVTGIRKGSSKNITQDIPAKVDSESKEYPRASLPKLTQYRKSFFATSSLHQLLVTSVNLYSFNSLNNQTTSQCHSQSSSKNLDRCLKLISFTVKACLRHLKSFNALESEVGGDPANTIVFGDVRKLGRPIIQLVWLLSSGPKPEKDRKKKEAKGKKNVESKGDQLFVSLQCLNELFKIKFSDSQLTELVEDFNSLAAEELDSEIDGARVINDNQDLMIGDQIVKSMHIFLEKRVKPLYSRLMALSLFQESEVLSELLLNIGKSLPREQRDYHGAWAVDISRSSKVENQSSARSVVALVTGLLPAPIDLIVAHEMGSELLKVMGSENRDPEEASGTFTVINYSTRNATATVLMQLVESCIVDLDWALVKLKAFSAFHNESTGAKENNQFGERPPGLIFEEAIYARSEALVYLLSSFTDMNLKDSQGEQLLRLTARFYKLLSRMTRLRIAPKGCKQLLPGQKFQKLAEVTCKELTSPLYNFVAMVQRIQQENAQSRGIISKIKRENRCIPDLIFQIEDYERYLIQLSKVTKVNLLRQAKRSTARDFKIGEVKKVPVSAEAPEGELRQEHSLSSDGESGEGTEEPDQEDGCEKILSPECSGGREGGDGVAAAEDSESEEDDQEMPMRKKRVRMTKVVQDSDEE